MGLGNGVMSLEVRWTEGSNPWAIATKALRELTDGKNNVRQKEEHMCAMSM